MKKFIIGMLLLSTTAVLAQEKFDPKEQRVKIVKQIEADSSKMQKLFEQLYDEQGNVRPDIQAQIDVLTTKINAYSGKLTYLYSIGFEKIQRQYRQSDILQHFRSASNKYASITAKDSKGQIISHNTLADLINDVYDKDIADKYGCYNDSQDTNKDRHTPYDARNAEIADSVMNSLGYQNYFQLEDDNKKTFCEVQEVTNSSGAYSNQCSDFLSGMRIALLTELEDQSSAKKEEITNIGYFNADAKLFTQLEVIEEIRLEVEDQVNYIEGLCADIRLQNDMEVFNYLEEQVEKDGVTIEYSNFNTDSSSNSVIKH